MKIKNKTYTGLLLFLVVSVCSHIANSDVFDFLYMRARAADSAVSVNFLPGNLSMSSTVSSDTNEINLDDIPDSGQYAVATFYANARDHRAAAPGWSMTATCSDFTDGTTNTIDVSNVLILPYTITPEGNSSLTGVSAGSFHYFANTSDVATLMTASAGNGRGRFSQLIYIGVLVNVGDAPTNYVGTVTQTIS